MHNAVSSIKQFSIYRAVTRGFILYQLSNRHWENKIHQDIPGDMQLEGGEGKVME